MSRTGFHGDEPGPAHSQVDSQPMRERLVFLVVLVVGSIAAAVVGGVNWGLYVATLGVAVGTLGLAYFTWALATRTQAAVEAARQELQIAEEGVAAATRTAVEAERARSDSLAPLIDLRVSFREALYRLPSEDAWTQFPENVEGGPVVHGKTLATADVVARFGVELFNYGRTPGYVKFTALGGMNVDGAQHIVRVSPDGRVDLEASLFWNSRSNESPGDPRTLSLQARVWGSMTRRVRDEIRWEGMLTLIRDYHGLGAGYQTVPKPLEQVDLEVSRHRDDERPSAKE